VSRLSVLSAVAAAVFLVACEGCGGGMPANATTGRTPSDSASTASIPTRATGWRPLRGKACPLHPAALAQLTSARSARQPVLPAGATAAWICLYTHGKPPDPRNGRTLRIAKQVTISEAGPALRFIASLPPHRAKPCTEVGGGLFDAVVLMNSKGQAFPVLATPTPPQIPSNCGVASTPNGFLEQSSPRLNRLLFHLAGQPFPG
jgi:hypothetical protein